MSGTYAAVATCFDFPVEEAPPTLEDTICYLRWRYPEMIENLDERMRHQREMVEEILKTSDLSARELLDTPLEEVGQLPAIVQLCYHVLKDINYIDSLR